MPELKNDGDLLDRLSRFYRDYYREEIGTLAQRYPHEQQSLWIDYQDVYRFDMSMADDLRHHADDFLEVFEEALVLFDLPVDISLDGANVRVYNLPEANSFNVGEYRSDNIGSLIAVTGQVSKRTKVRPLPTTAVFECQRCGNYNRIPQQTSELNEPHECGDCERQGPFRLDESRTDWEDQQMVRIQQPPEEVQGGQGVHVDAHMDSDIVDELESGDRVTVNGIMSLEQPSNGDIAFDPYIEVNSVEIEETDYDDIDIEEHREEIEAIANGDRGDPFELLIDSIAPKVRGMDQVKKALVLQLFGGVRPEYPDGSTDRGDSHILLLGDPGTAKSTLLHAVEKIAPRAAFASGKGASAAGMTAAAVPDDFGDQKWSLEAGAMVLANNGIACVDEIDKVKEDAVNSLHGALENQRVNVNKAGFNTTLPTKTALLAAGNPKHGRFDQYQPYAEQIDLDSALMSRFDLMYMIDDEPDVDEDKTIAAGVLGSRQTAARYTADDDSLDDEELQSIEPAIPLEVLRAYIAHAKKSVTPRISDTLKEELEDWFVDLRQANDGDEQSPVPVTFRKLEGAMRLAEASARVRLSDSINRDDIELAKRLVLRSMYDVGVDPETDELDADIVETGMSSSQRDRLKTIKDFIQELQSEHDEGVPEDVLLECAKENGMGKHQTKHELEKLKQQGEIYQPRNERYRTT